MNPLLAPLLAFVTSSLATPLLAKLMRRIGHVRPDAHKPGQPEVPTSCGLSIVLGLAAGLLPLVFALPSPANKVVAAFLATVATTALVGIVDDFVRLPGELKAGLTILGILPIAILAMLDPRAIHFGRPEVPIIGRLRLTLMYWLLLPLAIGGPANVVNMLDVLNGVMPLTTSLASAALLVSALLLGRRLAALLAATLLAAILGFLPFNKYPAKVFAGDAGSLAVGAAIGAIAVLGHLEMVALTALLPHLVNAFYVITHARGLKEHRHLRRPTKVLADGTIIDSGDPEAPITLVRMLAGPEGAREPELVGGLTILSAVSAALAIITAILIKMARC